MEDLGDRGVEGWLWQSGKGEVACTLAAEVAPSARVSLAFEASSPSPERPESEVLDEAEEASETSETVEPG